MFRGSAIVNLDVKGRFAIPARFRDRVQEACDGQLVVTVAIDEHFHSMSHCLWIYTLTEWEKFEKKIEAISTNKKKIVRFKRLIIGNAFDCEMDKEGRILLPEKLRSMANLDKKLVLAGQLNRLELWNEEAWEDQISGGNEQDEDDDEDDGRIELKTLSI